MHNAHEGLLPSVTFVSRNERQEEMKLTSVMHLSEKCFLLLANVNHVRSAHVCACTASSVLTAYIKVHGCALNLSLNVFHRVSVL